LRERLAAELDAARGEKRLHVMLPLGADERGDAFPHAPVRAPRILPGHRLPVGLHELPRGPATRHAREQRAHEERRVLAAHLAVDRALKGPTDQLGLPEASEGVEVALLLLRGARALEPLHEPRILLLAAAPRDHGDERGQDVRIDRELPRRVARVQVARALLGRAVVAERAEGANEVAAQLALELDLLGLR